VNFPVCLRNASVKYAISPANFTVIGSPHKESVDAQFNFVKLSIWVAKALKSGAANFVSIGGSTRIVTSSGFGVPMDFRYGLDQGVEISNCLGERITQLPLLRLPSVSGRLSYNLIL